MWRRRLRAYRIQGTRKTVAEAILTLVRKYFEE
jgi:hypothetical protein